MTDDGAATVEPKASAPKGTAGAAAADPDQVLAEVVELQKNGFSPGFLLEVVGNKVYSRTLTTDDLVKWKEAGVSEAVILRALERSR